MFEMHNIPSSEGHKICICELPHLYDIKFDPWVCLPPRNAIGAQEGKALAQRQTEAQILDSNLCV